MFDFKKEDSIIINSKTVFFDELFKKKIDYSILNYSFFENKIILVTGGGTIGSSLIKYLLLQNVKKIILVDHSEYAIFNLHLDLKQNINLNKIKFLLGDIRNTSFIDEIFKKFTINIVYHTAAYKHINILEDNMTEAITNNIDGTINLLNISLINNIDQFIYISTDKAVNPINKMGITKRIAELKLLDKIIYTNNSFIKIIRFGNVFNSSGSVFPIFKYQIENNKNLTITDSNMKRYFISKFQAARGLMEISNPSNPSGIYLLNMQESHKILILLLELLKKLDLEYLTKNIYITSNTKDHEKLEEELYYPYELIENCNNSFSKLKLELELNSKNEINAELINLYGILKK
ncbi:NAD-dependent epimerase/dehydratase family protein [Apibacter muscae]|uniref:polysaccharide biosynthesis protein n=1 Tax=Apibacter muscae TaxID=2509004 RepID=UPI0011AC7C53|nr:polysaccharide biosynthesis protein [Apibacter muscae]TWP22559.1 NAD-dependent epimerase/dehydratase family protein [Apibacter muscae]